MANILIIDDDPMLCDLLGRHIKSMGHEAALAHNIKEGLDRLGGAVFEVVMLDVNLPDGNGLRALPKIRSAPYRPQVIIITGEADPDGAELAIKSGAWDYIEKKGSMSRVALTLTRVLDYIKDKADQTARLVLHRDGIVGDSAQMKHCFELVAQAAAGNANVLITGETGTGKELFARAIHRNSRRSGKNLVVVDCAALPATLVESVLFGYRKGAFTGADASREGLVRQADGGSLFLDEVGELPMAIQKAFLRVLQERKFRPVGGKKEMKSDFRLVAATNRNLEEMAERGEFRMDLLYRLRAFAIHLPSLREHSEDIKDLCVHYLSKICDRDRIDTKGFSPDFIESLTAYDWPGNVRELANTIETVVAKAGNDQTLFSGHLPVHIRVHAARRSVGREKTHEKGLSAVRPFELSPFREYKAAAIEAAETRYLHKLLDAAEKDIRTACRISGLSRSYLYGLLKKHGMTASSTG